MFVIYPIQVKVAYSDCEAYRYELVCQQDEWHVPDSNLQLRFHGKEAG